jgi:hypothetical protein
MTSSPKHIGSAVAEGTSVPADFALPWNTTRTMADQWGLSAAELQAARDDKKTTVLYRRYVARAAPERSAPDAG